jgi:hypothetical protein
MSDLRSSITDLIFRLGVSTVSKTLRKSIYVKPEIKKMDERLTKDNGPIGRDALPAFKF